MICLKSSAEKVRKFYSQALAAFAVWILSAEIGIMNVWSSPYIAQLTAPGSSLPLTMSQASWIVSLLYVGRLIGAIFGAVLVIFCGSKRTVLITAFPIALGWIVTMFADSWIWLCVARVSLGTGFGLTYSSFALYLGEIASPEIRGSLVSFASMGAAFGNFLASIVGSNMSILSSSIVFFAPCILVLGLLTYLPNSPHHYIKAGDFEEAKKSIQWYHGSEDVEEVFDEVTMYVKSTNSTSFMEKLAEFKHPHVRRATFLVMMLFAFMQLSGLNNVFFYMETILNRAQFNQIKSSSIVSYALILSLIAACASIGVYDKCGRRIVVIVTSVGMSVGMAALGTHFVLMNAGVEWIGSQWLPVAALFVFIISFIVGFNSIPSIVSSEVYSSSVKSVAACMANLTAAAAAFLSSKAYQPIVDSFGEAYAFYGHALITIMAVPFALFYMPETKGKTLQQIQDDLRKK